MNYCLTTHIDLSSASRNWFRRKIPEFGSQTGYIRSESKPLITLHGQVVILRNHLSLENLVMLAICELTWPNCLLTNLSCISNFRNYGLVKKEIKLKTLLYSLLCAKCLNALCWQYKGEMHMVSSFVSFVFSANLFLPSSPFLWFTSSQLTEAANVSLWLL